MAAVWLLVRCDLRRRWRSLLVVALLVGLVGLVVLTAVAGARRTDSAYPRLLDAMAAIDDRFNRVIDAVAPASFLFVTPVGLEREPAGRRAPGADHRRAGRVPRIHPSRRPGLGHGRLQRLRAPHGGGERVLRRGRPRRILQPGARPLVTRRRRFGGHPATRTRWCRTTGHR